MAAISILDTDTVQQIWAKVIAATGNGKVDVGYQCGDSLPYFRFSTGDSEAFNYYTTVHPEHAEGKTLNVPVYSIVEGKKNGVTTRIPNLLGYGSQSGSILTYGSWEYNYQGDWENCRVFKINRWSKCKPIRATGDANIDFSNLGSREVGARYGLYIPISLTGLSDEHDVGAYIGLPSVPAGSSYPARLKDFHGYDPSAVLTLEAKVNHGYTLMNGHDLEVVITHLTNQPTSVNFDDIINLLGSSVKIVDRYPCIAVEVPVTYRPTLVDGTLGDEVTVVLWFSSKLYTSGGSVAKLGTAATTTLNADIDALITEIRRQYSNAILPNNYRAIIWLAESVSSMTTDWQSSIPSTGVMAVAPTNYVKWRDELYNFYYESSWFTSTWNSLSSSYSISVGLRFLVDGTTADNYKYILKYRYGTATTWNEMEMTYSGYGHIEPTFQFFSATVPGSILVEWKIEAKHTSSLNKRYTLTQGTTTVKPA